MALLHKTPVYIDKPPEVEEVFVALSKQQLENI